MIFLLMFYIMFSALRIDAEAHNIMEKLEKSKALNQLSNEASGNSSEETTALTMEVGWSYIHNFPCTNRFRMSFVVH